MHEQAELTWIKRRDKVVNTEILRGLINLKSQQLRTGLLCRERLSRLRFQIDEYELLAGRILPYEYTEEEYAEEYNDLIVRIGGYTYQLIPANATGSNYENRV